MDIRKAVFGFAIVFLVGVSLGAAGLWLGQLHGEQARVESTDKSAKAVAERKAKLERFNKRIEERFTSQHEAIAWLHSAASVHKHRLAGYGERAFDDLRDAQLVLAGLSLVATIMLAIKQPWGKEFAIYPTAIATALTGLIGFYDLQGSAARHYGAHALVSQIESEIEFRILLVDRTSGSNAIEPEQLKAWQQGPDAATSTHLDGFVKSVQRKSGKT